MHLTLHAVEPELLIMTHNGNETTENEDATFSCLADGSPPPVIHWIHNRTSITTLSLGPRQRITVDTVNSSSHEHIPTAVKSVLTVQNLSVRDSGDYSCRVDPADIELGGNSLTSEILSLYVKPGAMDELNIFTVIVPSK